jgi:hypothetical protein
VTWEEFEAEIARRGGAKFWWRDDDAAAASPELRRALALSRTCAVPLALAVIPEAAEPALFGLLHERITLLQHGTDHRNRAAPGEKKTEYPAAEPIEAALGRVSDGFRRLKTFAAERLLPVLAPPWNRVRKDLLDSLPAVGIRGVTLYGPRMGALIPQVNTHVDIVAWRRGRRFIGEHEALRLAANTQIDHPEAGVPHLERAIRLLERGKASPADLGQTQFRLAQFLAEIPRERSRARALAEAARASFATVHADAQVAEVDAFVRGIE